MKLWPISLEDGLWVVLDQVRADSPSPILFVFRSDAEAVCERRNFPNRFRVKAWAAERGCFDAR
jgi:hypothetical protein